jgi:hypothetical protein
MVSFNVHTLIFLHYKFISRTYPLEFDNFLWGYSMHTTNVCTSSFILIIKLDSMSTLIKVDYLT